MNRNKLNWTNTLFLTLTPLAAVVGGISLFLTQGIAWQTWLLAFIFTLLSGLSITCGYHRLFSHLAYKAHGAVRLVFVMFGGAAFEGSVLEWCTDHRDHHRYTDTDDDPYNAKRGFWFSHIGWLLRLDPSQRQFDNVDDLKTDSVLVWQHKHYVPLAVAVSFVLPMALAALWGDAWGGLLIAGALRITINQHFTFCINSVCHIFGKRTYSDRNTAKDNWFTALFTYGEGYHNFHHKFPLDFRNGIRFYDFDPSKWLIGALAKVGLASDLKTVSTQRIVQTRLAMDEKNLQSTVNELSPLVNQAREAVLQALTKLESIEKTYAEFKQKRVEFVNDKLSDYRQKMRDYRLYLKACKRDLKRSLKTWSDVVLQSNQQLAHQQ